MTSSEAVVRAVMRTMLAKGRAVMAEGRAVTVTVKSGRQSCPSITVTVTIPPSLPLNPICGLQLRSKGKQ